MRIRFERRGRSGLSCATTGISKRTPARLQWRRISQAATEAKNLWMLESPIARQRLGVRWPAGKGADTALDSRRAANSKAVCAPNPHPPHSKTSRNFVAHRELASQFV